MHLLRPEYRCGSLQCSPDPLAGGELPPLSADGLEFRPFEPQECNPKTFFHVILSTLVYGQILNTYMLRGQCKI